MKLSKSNIIILALVAIVVFLIIRGCSKSNEANDLKDLVALKEAEKDTLAVKLNETNGDLEYSKQAYAASEKNLEDYMKQNNKPLYDLKKKEKATAGILAKNTIKIDTTVKNKPSPIPVDTVKCNEVRTANIVTNDYKVDIISYPSKTSFNLYDVIDSVSYTFDKNYRLKATHTNGIIKVVELNSFYVKPDNKPKNFKYWLGAIAGGIVVYGLTR